LKSGFVIATLTAHGYTIKKREGPFSFILLFFNIFQVNREKEYAVKQEKNYQSTKVPPPKKAFSTGSRESEGIGKSHWSITNEAAVKNVNYKILKASGKQLWKIFLTRRNGLISTNCPFPCSKFLFYEVLVNFLFSVFSLRNLENCLVLTPKRLKEGKMTHVLG
jgi:hypothetical protein